MTKYIKSNDVAYLSSLHDLIINIDFQEYAQCLAKNVLRQNKCVYLQVDTYSFFAETGILFIWNYCVLRYTGFPFGDSLKYQELATPSAFLLNVVFRISFSNVL